MNKSKASTPSALRGGHPRITWAALQALPAWQRKQWGDERLPMSVEYSGYGDTYNTRKAEIGRFVELPDGSLPAWAIDTLRLHKNYGWAVDFWESPTYEQHEKTFVHFFRRIADCLAEGNIHDAAQYAGTLSHHVGDSGVPAHAVDQGDLETIKDLLPPPPDKVCFPLHGYTEQDPGPFLIPGYRPRLYGRTPEEAGLNYCDRYYELTRYARSLLLPLAECAWKGRDRQAGALRQLAAKMCARALADFYYTAGCMGGRRFEPRQVAGLKVLRLTERWPFRQSAWSPSPYFETGPLKLCGINLDADRKPVPCKLLIPQGGRARVKPFREALGGGAYYEYHYRIAAGVYRRFSAWVGIHATLGALRTVDVEVKRDGQSAFKDVIRPGQPARRVDVDAKGCRDLQLIASGPWLTEPDGHDNHVVWAEPRLSQ